MVDSYDNSIKHKPSSFVSLSENVHSKILQIKKKKKSNKITLLCNPYCYVLYMVPVSFLFILFFFSNVILKFWALYHIRDVSSSFCLNPMEHFFLCCYTFINFPQEDQYSLTLSYLKILSHRPQSQDCSLWCYQDALSGAAGSEIKRGE